MKRTAWSILIVSAVVLSILLGAANLFLGDLNQDEGWYLYAAKQVTGGRVLYRDFMFTQGPVLPVVYGVLFPMVEKLGLAGGRLITMLLGWMAAGCAAWTAWRIASRHRTLAAFAAFVLAGVNVYQSYFTTIVKTYGLCAFFLTSGFVALSYSNHKRGAFAAFWGGFLLALAACTRLSAGISLPIAGLWLVCNRNKVFPYGKTLFRGEWAEDGGRRTEDREESSILKFLISRFKFLPAWFAFGLGGGFVLLVGLVPFFVLAPENTHFALLGYHAGRSPGGLMELAALKAGFVSRFVRAYFVFAAGCAAAFLFRRHQRPVCTSRGGEVWNARPRLLKLIQQANRPESPFGHAFVSLLWLCGAAITLVHFSAPFPYDDYQVIVYPVLCTALAATVIPRIPTAYLLRTGWAVLLVCTAAAFSSPINQAWMVHGRDRIWWNFKDTPDLLKLQRIGAQVRKRLGKGGLLLTQDTYLAVEAGVRVPRGMEMGPFCYYPDMAREQAEQLNLLNKKMMLETLSKGRAPLAAFSGYGLTIESPSIGKVSSSHWKELRAVLEQNYARCFEIPNFGQAHTCLEVFERNCLKPTCSLPANQN